MKTQEMTNERAIAVLRRSNILLAENMQKLANTVPQRKRGKEYYDTMEFCKEEYQAVQLAILALIAERNEIQENVTVTVNYERSIK